jgi:hypothetical protein
MAHPIPNTFSSYNLTEQELKLGAQLSSLNVAVIQNLRSTIAEEKLNLVFTPNDVLSYTQQEAYLKGQLDILQHLLTSNEDSQQFHTINTQQE